MIFWGLLSLSLTSISAATSINTSSSLKKCDFLQYNQCISCDEPQTVELASYEGCSYLCPNRKSIGNMGILSKYSTGCALKECPKNLQYRSEYGNCRATKKIAEKDYDIYENNINNEDILASGFLTAPLAVNGKCPEDKPILYSGKCFSCDETDELYVEKSECDKCSNREYRINTHWRVNTCELRCPKDKPLQRWDGKCFSCDELKAIQLPTHCNLEQDCEDWCPNRTILYDLGGNVPSTISCPKDKPLMSSSGICYSCDAPIAVGVRENERLCKQACPTTRHIEGSDCVKNSTTKVKQ